MKKIILSFLVFSLLIVTGCEKNNTVETEINNGTSTTTTEKVKQIEEQTEPTTTVSTTTTLTTSTTTTTKSTTTKLTTTSTATTETTTTSCPTKINGKCKNVGDIITVGAKVTGTNIAQTVLIFNIPDGLEFVSYTPENTVSKANVETNPVIIEYMWDGGNPVNVSNGIYVYPLKYKITKEGNFNIALRNEADGKVSVSFK